MSKVTSRLTTEEQKQLSQFFGKVNLHLLYKASVHGFSAKAFHAKCDGQGPTLTVGYNNGYTFGGYTSEDFITNGNKYDNDAFLFRLTSSELGERPLKFAVKADTLAVCNSLEHGPNFGNSLVFLARGNTIKCKSGPSYSFNKNDLFGGDVELLECEVYRVEAVNTPWREIKHLSQNKESVRSFKPYLSSVPKARILLIGPIGAGKSSFINSVNSVFRGHVTNRALTGGRAMNTTKKYSTFSFRSDWEDTSMPLILCDTMGLPEDTESGIHTDDIISIIKGHVPKRYQFNPASPIQPDTNGYIKSPTIAERIHCVVYVIDASKPTIISPAMEKKMCAIRSQINKLEIPQMVLLTKVDEACPLVMKSAKNVYQSKLIEKKVLEVGKQLNIPALCIVPVKSYCAEFEFNDYTSNLLMSAVVQMLHYADDYFENLDEDLPAV